VISLGVAADHHDLHSHFDETRHRVLRGSGLADTALPVDRDFSHVLVGWMLSRTPRHKRPGCQLSQHSRKSFHGGMLNRFGGKCAVRRGMRELHFG